ncbi:hypothetical protein AOZ06_38945 [Kibdelosporangium phytohabitans]|uniref:Uncharacterized protein n=1 Tax=Kibdelosporangium phytohabitans TaxID=860235 RepID=A0A0N9I846_9PSEU|nr:hypothetical protein AOZ06_38945 [Kibdelosporangium phytohabitans]
MLVGALVVLPVAAFLFGMTATNLGGPGDSQTALPSLAVIMTLLAIRFNWARVTSTVLLVFLTIVWLPGAIEHLGDARTGQVAVYVVVGTVLFVAGAVLVYLPASNDYYHRAARWRRSRKQPGPQQQDFHGPGSD